MGKHKKTATTQKWGHSSWMFFWCLSKFPPLLLCLFWCLCRLGDSDFTKHWQASKKQKKQTTRCTKRKHNFQQLPRSGAMVLVFFFWCLLMFPPLPLFFGCLCRFGDSDFTKHWQATKKTKPPNAPNLHRHQIK